MSRERVDGWCEKGILVLVLGILVFAPLALGCVRGQGFAVVQWLTAGVALLWLARFWLNPNQPVLWPPIAWAVLAFALYAAVRYATADVEYVARQEVLRVLVYAVLFFAISSNLSRQRHEKAIVFTLLILAAALALYAIHQFATNSQKVWEFPRLAYGRRGSGTYFNPNHLAGFLEMLAPAGLAFTVAGRLNPLGRIVLGYASAMALAGIGVSLSRGGWLASGLAMVVLLAVLMRQGVHRAVCGVLLAVLVLAGAGFVLENQLTQRRFAAMFQEGRIQDVRFRLWEPAVEIWRENFWFGAGPGHFDVRFRQHRPPDVQMRPDRAHNDYLNTLADWGLVGAALVALPWLLLFAGLWRSWNQINQTQNSLGDVASHRLALAVGASVGLVAILLHSVMDFNMHIPANAILAVTLMALLTGLWRRVTDRYSIKPGNALRLAASAALLAASALLVWQGVRRWNEERLLAAAARAQDAPAEAVAALERAFDAEPQNPDTAYRLGEAYRLQSWQGERNYAQLAERAIRWYDRAMTLQPWDPYSRMGKGMCLDWIGRHDDAKPWFHRAHELDPNNFHILAHVGWHYAQAGQYAEALPWLELSVRIRGHDNPVAFSYLDIVRRRLEEAKTAGKPN